MLSVRRWGDAGSAVRGRKWQVHNAETGQQKVQLLSKTKHFAYLGILLQDP